MITLTREEAQQVLDALEFVYPLCEQLHHPKKYRHEFSQPCGVVEQYKATTETLRARLAKKEFVVPPIDGDTTPWARSDEGW